MSTRSLSDDEPYEGDRAEVLRTVVKKGGNSAGTVSYAKATRLAKKGEDYAVELVGDRVSAVAVFDGHSGPSFAEACSKSDEYTEANAKGWRPLLLCRVACGMINYNAEVGPDVNKLVKSCTEGTYHCVLGDREKCRGTFREFIVYDNDQAYPEYIIWYSRYFN